MKNQSFTSRAWSFAVIVASFAIGTLFGAGATGVPNFQKVNDSVYRGGQPSEEGFKSLATMGVKTILDLRGTEEHSQGQEEAWAQADGMRYISLPLKGMAAPLDADVAKALAILNDPAAGPVFVHCRRGADRTGTILACYRISHDHWNNLSALKEARGLGMRFFERAMQNYVKHYGVS